VVFAVSLFGIVAGGMNIAGGGIPGLVEPEESEGEA